ncbi:MAG: CotH kinase family protein [Pseudomonadota bacterium]|nr:CotH kinase family protein [Pseudomonadota bacterium]
MLYLLACLAPPGGEEGEARAVRGANHVVLNEVVVRNQSTWDDGSVRFPDWVELYNTGKTPVAVPDLTLSDGLGIWRGEGVLRPGERLLVPLGDDAPFQLGADETLTLSDGTGVLDRLSLGDPRPDVAWARHPDGGSWAETLWATPESPNPDAPSDTLDASDLAFGPGVLHTAAIELSADAVASLEVDRLAWVEGAVTLDGLRYAPVAVRLKSSFGSSREIGEKPGWKIDLDEFADLRWRGQKKLTLNNLVQDETYLREHLTYTFFRAMGVPAPRVGWMTVTLNGEPYGISLLVESVDDTFLERWYEDPTGALYEGSRGDDLVPGDEGAFEYDEGPDPDDRADLTAVIDVLQRPPDDSGLAQLEALFDVEQLLTYLATESLALHWDGYKNTNNYRLYHDPQTGRFDMLPWGTDNTFDVVALDPWGGHGKLVRWCVALEACRIRYDTRLVEVADQLDTLGLVEETLRVDAWLRPAIEHDRKREFGMPEHDIEVGQTLERLEAWPEEVRVLVDAGWVPRR